MRVSMAREGAIYVLGERATGLRLAEVVRLLALLDRLVEDGHTAWSSSAIRR